MQIETKFNIDDKLWFIDGQGKILEVIIKSIDIKVSGRVPNHHFDSKTVIEYHVRTASKANSLISGVKEERLYNTKQEAGEAWLKSQGLKSGVNDD